MTVEERTVSFPAERSLGALYMITSKQGQNTWWEKKVGEAHGYVNVPVFGYLHLLVDSLADLTTLAVISPDSLASVDFRQRPVTDLELSYIQNLIGLKYLTLPASPITDRGLMYLVNLYELNTLDLGDTGITDEGLSYIKHLTRLKKLYLDGTKVTDHGVRELSQQLPGCHIIYRSTRTIRFPELESIGKVWVAKTSETGQREWQEHSQAKGIVEVSRRDFVRLELEDADGLFHFASLKPDDIQSLDYIAPSVDEDEWNLLTHLSGLRELRLAGAELMDGSLAGIGGLPHLRSLQLTSCVVGPDVLKGMARVPTLRELRLSHCNLDDAGLGMLSQSMSLRKLLLEGDSITDQVMSQFDRPCGVNELYIVFARVTDRGLAALEFFPRLRSLVVRADDITEIGLANLRKLGELRRLFIRGDDIGDDALIHISRLSSLRDLTIRTLTIRGDSTALLSDLVGLRKLSIGAIIDDSDPDLAEYFKSLRLQIANLPYLQDLTVRFSGESMEFSELPGLKSLDIANNPVRESRLYGLETLTALQSLSIKGCSNLGDRTLDSISNLKYLEELDLSLTAGTDYGANRLAALPQLRYIALSGGSFTNKALEHLSENTTLRFIDYPQSLEDDDLQYLNRLVRLRNLRLGRVSDEGMEYVATLTNVRDLDFSRSSITDDTLAFIANYNKLIRLNLSGTDITDTGLMHVSRLGSLRSLNLANTMVTDLGLASLSNLTRLQSVDLENCSRFQSNGLSFLKLMTGLRFLNLRNSSVSDSGLVNVRSLRNLQTLRLAYTLISDQGLAHIDQLTRLRVLDLENTDITGAGLSNLWALSALTELRLAHTNVDDTFAENIGDLINLRDLDLANTKISADSLKYIGQLEKLEFLNLVGTSIRYKDLVALERLVDLNRVYVNHDEISNRDRETIARTLPGCEIHLVRDFSRSTG